MPEYIQNSKWRGKGKKRYYVFPDVDLDQKQRLMEEFDESSHLLRMRNLDYFWKFLESDVWREFGERDGSEEIMKINVNWWKKKFNWQSKLYYDFGSKSQMEILKNNFWWHLLGWQPKKVAVKGFFGYHVLTKCWPSKNSYCLLHFYIRFFHISHRSKVMVIFRSKNVVLTAFARLHHIYPNFTILSGESGPFF